MNWGGNKGIWYGGGENIRRRTCQISIIPKPDPPLVDCRFLFYVISQIITFFNTIFVKELYKIISNFYL